MLYNRKKSSLEEAQINLTPLIDVVFVILIMFIVVAPLLEIDRVELADGPPLAGQNTLKVQEKSPVTIHVQADNSIYLNKMPVTLEELSNMLVQAKEKNPKAKPQLFHDKKACFGTFQSIKNALEKVGFLELEVILKPE